MAKGWKTVAGGVFAKKMDWGGELVLWEGPKGRCYSCEMQGGGTMLSFGWSPMSREEIVERCIESNAESYARNGFPEKVERERLQSIQRQEDERRAQDNYPAALTLLAKCAKRRASSEEIQAFLDYDAALQKVAEAKVEKERQSHIELKAAGW